MKKLSLTNGEVKNYTIVLSTKNYTHYGEILFDKETLTINQNLNSADEISFTVYKEVDGKKNRLWNDIVDLKLVWVKELNEYFQIEVSESDTYPIKKTIVGTSLCEAELGQIIIRDTYINTEEDIERDDYEITKFYDYTNPNASFLHRILSKAPHYKIKHVDLSLCNLQRSFSVNNTSIYDFLTGECADEFQCLFLFDSTDRGIYVYDLCTVCSDCGYRGEYTDQCPECGGLNLTYYGEDTTVLVSKDNLTEEVNFTTDVGSIKNCFYLEAGDDLMSATVASINPNGSRYIYYVPKEQRNDMSTELLERLDSYDILYNSKTASYATIMENLYECIDKILYYTSSMMPTIEESDVTASTEAMKLTYDNLNPLGLSSITTSTSTATVNSAMKNYAKVFVKSGYVKVEIDEGAFSYVGTDVNGNKYGTWTGRYKITNYSDENDVAYSDYLTIKVYDNYLDFLNQKIKKNIATSSKDDESIYDVLNITDQTLFTDALTYYSLNRLTSFYDAIQSCIDILIEEHQANPSSEFYSSLYTPYYNKLLACQEEIDKRQSTIDKWTTKKDEYEKQRDEIQEALNFQKYLGEDLYLEFCSYHREDTYSNSNYISDGLSNTELFQNAREFLEVAKKEIVKSGEYQHSITSNLYNLLLIKEFESILDKLELGNWIRVKMDDEIYRLRFIGYQISFSDITKINVTFSDVTKTANGMNDVNSIIKSAQSMASTYSYITRQASKGEGASDTFEKIQQEGFDSAMYKIKNADTEEIIYDNHGLLCRSYDDITDDYSPEQFKLTHNVLAYTTDYWKSIQCALGKQSYTLNGVKYEGYGLNADFCIASMIIGATINNGNGTFKVDKNGNLTATSATVTGKISASSGSNFGKWYITDACIYRTSPIFGSPTTMYFGDDGLSVSNSFRVNSNGELYASNANITGTVTTSNLTASGGTIANFVISNGYLYNGIGIGTTGSCGIGAGTARGGNDDWIFWAGNGNFRVNANGDINSNSLICTSATITGGTFKVKTMNSNNNIISLKSDYNGYELYTHVGAYGLKTGYGDFASTLMWHGLEIPDGGYLDYKDGKSMVGATEGYIGTLVSMLLSATTGSIGTLTLGSDPIITSDKDLKNSIESLDINDTANFIYALNPCQFKYNDGTSNRYHHGLIASEVKEVMSDKDWGLYVDTSVIGENKESHKALRYGELIADLIATVQSQNKRIIQLEMEKANG